MTAAYADTRMWRWAVAEDVADQRGWAEARRRFLSDDAARADDERESTEDDRSAQADEDERRRDELERSASAALTPEQQRSYEARATARQARARAMVAREDARRSREAQRQRSQLESPSRLALLFADVARQLFAPGDLETVFARIVSAATVVVPSCEHASITMVIGGEPATVASTSKDALVADEAQYGAGEGPCIAALREPVIVSEDITTDERWPRLAARAVPLRSVASFGLYEATAKASGQPASLNLYSETSSAFDHHAWEMGIVLAAHASTALLVAFERDELLRRDRDLHTALLSRDVIGQAKGILMERERVTADQAFDILRRTSQLYNRKLRDIAERLAETGSMPPVPPE